MRRMRRETEDDRGGGARGGDCLEELAEGKNARGDNAKEENQSKRKEEEEEERRCHLSIQLRLFDIAGQMNQAK